jgi:hypothetical protein
MAKVIQGFVFSGRAFGQSKYDWAKWLDGQAWQLEPSDVGGAFPKHFAHQCKLAAKKRGVTVRVEKANGGYVVQAILPNAQPAAEPAAATPPLKKGKGK